MKCVLCKSESKDDILYGDFLVNEKSKLGVHTFCLYLSSNLSQRGEDDQGFLGFLEEDIQEEVQRAKRLHCCYCRKTYASIGCCEKKCRRSFHIACGLEHGVQTQFCRSYDSFCHEHVRYKFVPRLRSLVKGEFCCICYDPIVSGQDDGNELMAQYLYLRAPCCRNGWFHRNCLQKFAKTAGYFFKCPLCNDEKKFRCELTIRGIFIPNQDAAWELDANAYAELLERPDKCTAPICYNKMGRNAQRRGDPFICCYSCGSVAQHRRCLQRAKLSHRNFQCDECRMICQSARDGGGEEDTSSSVNPANDDSNVTISVSASNNDDDCPSDKDVQSSETEQESDGSCSSSISIVSGKDSNDKQPTKQCHDSHPYPRGGTVKLEEEESSDSCYNINRNCLRNRRHRQIRRPIIYSDDDSSYSASVEFPPQQRSAEEKAPTTENVSMVEIESESSNCFSPLSSRSKKRPRRLLTSSEEEEDQDEAAGEKNEELVSTTSQDDGSSLERQSIASPANSMLSSTSSNSNQSSISNYSTTMSSSNDSQGTVNHTPIAFRTRRKVYHNYHTQTINDPSGCKRNRRENVSRRSQRLEEGRKTTTTTAVTMTSSTEDSESSNWSVTSSMQDIRKNLFNDQNQNETQRRSVRESREKGRNRAKRKLMSTPSTSSDRLSQFSVYSTSTSQSSSTMSSSSSSSSSSTSSSSTTVHNNTNAIKTRAMLKRSQKSEEEVSTDESTRKTEESCLQNEYYHRRRHKS